MILRALYRLLLHLKPEAWRNEMAVTFEQAQGAAWSKGWLPYIAFGFRELGGLLRGSDGHGGANAPVRSGWLRAVGLRAAGLAAGTLVGLLVWSIAPNVYTSTATLRTVPGFFPQRLTPPPAELTVATLLESMAPVLTSRNSLYNLIDTHELYLPARARLPMEDVIELMRERIRIEAQGQSVILVAFSDPDQYRAQKVTRDLMTRIIDETVRSRSSASKMVVEFFKESVQSAAFRWDELAQEARAGGATQERRQMDKDIARRQYEALKEKLSEAETLMSLELRKQGPTLEVLELPSLPEHRDGFLGMSEEVFVGACALAGFALSLIASWLVRLRVGDTSPAALIRA